MILRAPKGTEKNGKWMNISSLVERDVIMGCFVMNKRISQMGSAIDGKEKGEKGGKGD